MATKPREPYVSKIRNVEGELLPTPVAARRKPRHNNGGRLQGKVIRSSRWFGAKFAELYQQIEAGKISAAEGQRRANVLKMAAEHFMAHVILDMQGLDNPLDLTPRDEENYQPAPVVAHRTERVSVTRGRGRHGEVVDSKTVVVTGTGDDEDLEPVAEIEALS